MLSTAIIIFRETLEIAMIIGIMLAATQGLANRMIWIVGGAAGGLLGAGLIAVLAKTISASLSGMGQEFFNALILFTAALLIGWTTLWVRANARTLKTHLHKAGQDLKDGQLPLYSLAIVIGLALLREGSEIVLFIYGMTLSSQSTSSIVAGTLLGLGFGSAAGVMLYYGLLKIPMRYMMEVISWLLIFMVAGLASQGVGHLLSAGFFSEWSRPIWDISWLLSNDSLVGAVMHGLVGYSARPTGIHVAVYLFVLMTLLILTWLIDNRRAMKLKGAVAMGLLLGFVVLPHPAFALGKIYSPAVEEGELALEYAGTTTFDPDTTVSDKQRHSLGMEYGVNGWWMAEISAKFAKDPHDTLKFEKINLESRFQLTEPGEYWMDTGLLLEYGVAVQAHQLDSVEALLLLQKDFGRFTATSNIGFEKDIGNGTPTGGPEYLFLANMRYRYSEELQPGLEIQSELGQSRTLGYFDRQEHYVGPALYGRLFGNVKYQAGWLLGVTDSSAESAARIMLEYEMHI